MYRKSKTGNREEAKIYKKRLGLKYCSYNNDFV